MKHLRSILFAALLVSPASAQTVKTLGYNAANGQVIANTGTNTLTFTNAIGFSDAAGTRSNLGLGSAATNPASAFQPASAALTTLSGNNAANLTNFPTLNQNTTGTANNVTGIVAIINGGTGATNAAGARANLSLGTAATNDASAFQPASANLTTLAANNAANLTNFPTLNQNTTGTASNVTGVVAVANGGTGANNAATARTNLGGTSVGNAVFTATNAAAAATAIGLGTTNNVTFSNITANGTLTVRSLATTDPVSWALDAVQTAAATNGTLTLPDNANVLRVTNTNTISAISNGRLGAFYFLINQSAGNLVISNTATIAVRGAANLTLGTNQAATIIATTSTNASVH